MISFRNLEKNTFDPLIFVFDVLFVISLSKNVKPGVELQ